MLPIGAVLVARVSRSGVLPASRRVVLAVVVVKRHAAQPGHLHIAVIWRGDRVYQVSGQSRHFADAPAGRGQTAAPDRENQPASPPRCIGRERSVLAESGTDLPSIEGKSAEGDCDNNDANDQDQVTQADQDRHRLDAAIAAALLVINFDR
jgi:hypothetical protein